MRTIARLGRLYLSVRDPGRHPDVFTVQGRWSTIRIGRLELAWGAPKRRAQTRVNPYPSALDQEIMSSLRNEGTITEARRLVDANRQEQNRAAS